MGEALCFGETNVQALYTQGEVLWRREDTMDMQKHQEYVDQLGQALVKFAGEDGAPPEMIAAIGVAVTLICEFMQDGKRIADALERQNALTAEMMKVQGYKIP